MLEKWLPCEAKATAGTSEPQGMNDLASGRQEETVVPIFDRAAIMKHLMNDEELVRVVAQEFLQDTPKQIQKLRGFLDAADLTAAQRQAHSIKGAAAGVGGKRLQAAAFELEKACQAGPPDILEGYVQELQTQFGQLQEAMEEGL